MSKSTRIENAATLRSLARRISLSRWVLGAERIAQAFWPLWALLLTFLACVLFGVFESFGPILHSAALGAFAIGAVWLGWRGARHLKWPERPEAVARLDDDMPGRPVSALADAQALGHDDPATTALWEAHQARMAERAAKARVAPPDLALSKQDPWALRLIAVTAAIAALIFAREDALDQLTTALSPEVDTPVATVSFEAWASPPAYTGKPTIYLSELLDADEIELPQGSEIILRVYGVEEDVQLSETVSGTDGTALDQTAESIRDGSVKVMQAGELALSANGRELADWSFTVVPDAPPQIDLVGELDRTVLGAMELSYTASDDYGVTAAEVTIELDLDAVDRRHGLAAETELGDAFVLDLPLPLGGSSEEIEETLVEDLSKHPYAGLPVRVTLKAIDAAEQEGVSETVSRILPGRRFFDDVAGSLVEMRRDLLWSKANAERVAMLLRTITHRPEDGFKNERAYLVTRTAIRRLEAGIAFGANGLSDEIEEEVAELLWQAALMIEDGDLASAQERLRQAQERLKDALENGATEEEIAELMQELREAMDNYMRQLAQEAERNQNQQQAQNPQDQMSMSQDQLQEMMDRIQELAENGQMEEAQQLLEMLQRMTENMQMTQQQGQGQGQQGQNQQTMQDLQDTLRQQQQLSDEAFEELQRQFQERREAQRNQQGQQQGQQGQQQGEQGQQPGQQGQQGQQGQNGQQGQQGQGGQQGQAQNGQQGGQGGQQGQNGQMSPGELAQRQEALRQLLDGLRGQVPGGSGGETGQALDRAERDMGSARDNLNGGDLPGALDDQAQAMENLREGLRQLGEEMARQSGGQQPGQDDMNQGAGPPNGSVDPLGRLSEGVNGGDPNARGPEVPGRGGMRAQELFDEIRRRSGERSRSQFELDYLRRLLDRF